MVKIYSVEDDRERYIPITLDSLVPSSQIPFEIFTHDGTFYKSLLDKNSVYSYFARKMIEDQALSSFYIRQGNALSFEEYMRNADKLKKMLLDPCFFESRYRDFRDKWFIVDKHVLNAGIPFTIPLAGIKFPLFGEIPFVIDSTAAYRHLLDLNSDIAISKQDIDAYYTYLDTVLDTEDIGDPIVKLRARREKVKVWCYRVFAEARNNAVTRDTLLMLYKHICIVMTLIANDFSYAGKFLFFDVSDTFLYIHATNVCMMSLMHGHVLNMEETELLNLGIAAILHDVGLVTIADDVSEDSPNEIERELYKSHVLRGKELLDQCKDIPKAARTVALTHHEREDGSGYPDMLTGSMIHPFAKIVALADTFERLRVAGFKHTSMKRTKVLEYMVHNGHAFNPDYLKTFLQFVAGLAL
jgi:HD-GYP domain-containing protein (c-di-GMP phosphodiesterase class II)